jgi:hypothetical protein
MQRRTKMDTARTDTWIPQQKITAQQFSDVDLSTCLLQAQKIARNTLKDHANLLCTYNKNALNAFLQKMAWGKTRSKLREQHAGAIFKICAQVNRKLYPQQS